MVKLEDRYQLCTKAEYASYVRRALDIRRNTPLSQAAMEVLAIVAYNQPVTKAFIEQVRGVDCGAVLQGLVGKKSGGGKKGGWSCPVGPFCMARRRISSAASASPACRSCRPFRSRRKTEWRKRRWTM